MNKDNDIKVLLIYGSTREGRFCDTIAGWACGEIESRNGLRLDVLDPARHEPRDELRDRLRNGPDVAKLTARIAWADAFVVVTPEYNHGYPASLKQLIDSAYDEWQAKPVGFVSYGGMSGGIRAVEQLRQVFAELHAVTVRDSVSFINAWNQFDAQGSLSAPERAQRSMHAMLTQLQWWAHALRDARSMKPYSEVTA